MLNFLIFTIAANILILNIPQALYQIQNDMDQYYLEQGKVEGSSVSMEIENRGFKPSPIALLPEMYRLMVEPPAGTKKIENPNNNSSNNSLVASTSNSTIISSMNSSTDNSTEQESSTGIITAPSSNLSDESQIITSPASELNDNSLSQIITSPAPETYDQVDQNSDIITSPTNNDQTYITQPSTPIIYNPPTNPTYTSPESSQPTNLPAAPTTLFSLTIPEIGLYRIPIIETDMTNESQWRNDLNNGVGLDMCKPGKNCKIFLFGHSTYFNNVVSNYKFVFREIDKLRDGSIIYIDMDGLRYTYRVYKGESVGSNTPSITTNYGREEVILMTCKPDWTYDYRYIIYANPLF